MAPHYQQPSELDYALWLLGEQTLERNDKSAEAKTREVLAFIKTEAAARARNPASIDPASKFYVQLTTLSTPGNGPPRRNG